MLEYDRNIDLVNIEIFKRTGTDNANEKRYRCVICKKPVSLDDGCSSKGHKFICWQCAKLIFGYSDCNGVLLEVKRWQHEVN